MVMTSIHKFWVTQPTTSFVLMSTQLMIMQRIPGKALVAFMPNCPRSFAKAFSFILSHPFTPFSSLGGGLPPAAVPHLESNTLTKTPIAIPVALRMEVIIMSCSQNSICIRLPKVVSLSRTLVIVSLKLVIWFMSLPLSRLMLSCLTFRSSFSQVICFRISSHCTSV